jgi:hypothetical protein
MPVRKTESRLPEGFTAGDLGQSSTAAGNTIHLVSFFSSPVALRRTQVYVVFVTDAALAPQVGKYEWTFTNGGSTTLQTDEGLAEFTPQNLGALNVTVKVKGSGTTVHATLAVTQQVIALNSELELLIDQQESNVPRAAHPETSRELLNEIRGYVDVLLPGPANEVYNKTLSSLAYARCLEPPQFRRHLLLERHAAVINSGNHKDFLSATKTGFGICKTRPQLLAMFLKRPGATDPFIDLVELADAKAAEKAIAKTFNDATKVTEAHKIDLFNLLRFPKSHLAMVKLVIDGLLAKYFAGAQVPQVLKEKAKGKALLSQFETGPSVKGGSIKVTAASGQIFQLLAQKIWTIKVTPIAGAPVGGGGTPAQPGPVGTPEQVPVVTFVAETSPNEKGFLAQATAYHATFGLNPQVAKSFEDMVRILAGSTATISRLRIVSHFFVDEKGNNAQVFIPFFNDQFFTDGSRYFHTEPWHFEYAISDAAGLLAHFQNEKLPFVAPGFLSIGLTEDESAGPNPRQIALHAALFKVLKNRNDPSLAPFKFKSSGPAGAALKVVQWAGDLFAIDRTAMRSEGKNPTVAEAPLPAPIVAAYKTFVRSQIDKLKTTTGVMVAANVDPLVAAITGLTINDLPVPGGRTTLGTLTVPVSGRFLQNHTTFRNNLATVRTRLKNGFIDIRGCEIGKDKAYMQAMRKFFGVVGEEPVVSGPQWLQAFSVVSQLGVGNEFTVDTLFTSGHSSSKLTRADVQRAYADWSGMIGLGAQLSFWAQLFAADKPASKIAFLARAWIARLPPLGMNAAHVTGLSALSYPALLVRLREIFFIDPTTGPTAAEATAFNTSSMAKVMALNGEIDAIDQLPANASQTVLQARLNALQAVGTATLPTPPSPLTIDFLTTTCIPLLSTPLVTGSKIDPLLTALKAKADDPKFGIRFMMGSGLPLLVQSAQKEDEISIMFFTPRLTDAFKSLAGIHWQKPLPGDVANAIANLNPVGTGTSDAKGVPTNDTARAAQLSLLLIDERRDPRPPPVFSKATLNPENEFASLITRVP